jgi:uncharacterized membrane protein YkvA (DUF1232 family)
MNSLQSWLATTVTTEELVSALAQRSGGAPARFTSVADVLQPFIGSIPQALAAMYAIGKHPARRRATNFVMGQVLCYLVDDDDLLPDTKFGSLGLLDDAYLAHSAAIALMRAYPFVDTSEANYVPPDRRAFQLVRTILPAGVADALDRTCSDLVYLANSLFGSPMGTEIPASATDPILRIDEALTVLSDR